MGFQTIGEMTRRIIEELGLEQNRNARGGDEGPGYTAPRAIPHGLEGDRADTVGNKVHHAASLSVETPMMSAGVSGMPSSRAAASKGR